MAYPQPVPIPDIPHDSPITFEVIVFCYTTISLLLQYLNLYRTVWWLPHSYNNQTMNFYLIDPYVIIFAVVLLARRLLYIFPVPSSGLLIQTFKYLTIAGILATLGYLA